MSKAKGTLRAGQGGKRTKAGARREAAEPDARPELQPAAPPRAKVWAYRQGLGDCFLLAFPREKPGADGRTQVFILIDCGVVLGTPDAAARMREVVRDIRQKIGPTNHLDVLVVTHEHWDHLSGFLQAEDDFDGLAVGEVWLGWTENPQDPQASALAASRAKALGALRLAAAGVRLAGDGGAADDIENILGFFGAAKGGTTRDALGVVRRLGGSNVVYREPGEAPIALPDVSGVRVFVLGPPRDERLLKRTDPRHDDHEGYGLALDLFLEATGDEKASWSPFDPMRQIPMPVAREIGFFKTRYWEAGKVDEGWRRIDNAWMGDPTEFALRLDNLTNNTSLVLAFELPDGDVLLFVADAQAGNWLSWQSVNWTSDSGDVSGPDLLRRAIFYKVGHHGSHNATLKEGGLEIMERLQLAYIPVDHDIALKKRWTRMPLQEIVERLEELIPGRVLRADQVSPVAIPDRVVTTKLYFELTF
nr:MBL fold metallo-hydrolase [Methylobacterium sp. L1A1]